MRRLMTRRLLVLTLATCAALATCTALALAALGGSGAKPPDKPLAQAVHDAAAAAPVQGVTARIEFTNRLIDSSMLSGSNPLLAGASGRLWASRDGRLRLELQSSQGDVQVMSDGRTATIYDATSNTVYKVTLPQQRGKDTKQPDGVPSVQRIEHAIAQITKDAVDLSGPIPGNIAGQPAYTVRISPKHDGGLIGAGELAWAAANGTPLRAAIYASGDPKPVLELKATDISFGPVAASDLDAGPPVGAKVSTIDLGGHDAGAGTDKPDVTGVQAVSAALPFKLSAPGKLVGLPRHEVRLVDVGGAKGALVTYGAGLGGIAVLEQPATGAAPGSAQQGDHGGGLGLSLPTVSINGTPGQELATALGTVVRFDRGGVRYTLAGSVPPAAAEAAARAL